MDRRNKLLTNDQIEDLLEISFGSDKENGEEDNFAEFSDHNSESEQSIGEYESESERGFNDFGMTCSESAPHSRTEQHNIIRFKAGPKLKAEECQTILQVFRKFLTDNMLDLIVTHTNAEIFRVTQKYNYAQSFNGDTYREEILSLIGLLFLSGVMKSAHENILDLWDTNGWGRNIFRASMSVRRFRFLVSCLRFDDKNIRSHLLTRDNMAHCRQLFEMFTHNCRKNYVLSEECTIDEMLRSFRGRCHFKQYMPKKPAKYGIKKFLICDAKTYYMWDAIVYVGTQPDAPKDANSAKTIVEKLTEKLRGSGRNITLDNWFTSFPLAHELLLHNITIVGTLKKNKKEIPKSFLADNKKKVNICFITGILRYLQ